MSRQLLTVYECAEILNVNYRTTLNLIHHGHLHALRLGSKYRVSQKELDRFIDSADKKTKFYKIL